MPNCETQGLVKLNLIATRAVLRSLISKVIKCLYNFIKMDWLGLCKHTFTFGSTGFDIVSDVANSLNFLGVFNKNTYNNITSLSFRWLLSATEVNRDSANASICFASYCTGDQNKRQSIM